MRPNWQEFRRVLTEDVHASRGSSMLTATTKAGTQIVAKRRGKNMWAVGMSSMPSGKLVSHLMEQKVKSYAIDGKTVQA